MQVRATFVRNNRKSITRLAQYLWFCQSGSHPLHSLHTTSLLSTYFSSSRNVSSKCDEDKEDPYLSRIGYTDLRIQSGMKNAVKGVFGNKKLSEKEWISLGKDGTYNANEVSSYHIKHVGPFPRFFLEDSKALLLILNVYL